MTSVLHWWKYSSSNSTTRITIIEATISIVPTMWHTSSWPLTRFLWGPRCHYSVIQKTGSNTWSKLAGLHRKWSSGWNPGSSDLKTHILSTMSSYLQFWLSSLSGFSWILMFLSLQLCFVGHSPGGFREDRGSDWQTPSQAELNSKSLHCVGQGYRSVTMKHDENHRTQE